VASKASNSFEKCHRAPTVNSDKVRGGPSKTRRECNKTVQYWSTAVMLNYGNAFHQQSDNHEYPQLAEITRSCKGWFSERKQECLEEFQVPLDTNCVN